MFLHSQNIFRKTIVLALLSIIFHTVNAQVSIPVESRSNAILLQTDKDNRLRMVYSGAVLADKKDYSAIAAQYDLDDGNQAGVYNNAYSTAGTYSLTEPAMQVTHADGNMSLDLKYVSHEVKNIDDNTTLTSILLQDGVYPFKVTLFYKVWKKGKRYRAMG